MITFLRRHWTVRTRLTTIYGGLFFLAGAVLLGVTYLLLQQTLNQQPINSAIVVSAGPDPVSAGEIPEAKKAVGMIVQLGQAGSDAQPSTLVDKAANDLTAEQLASITSKYQLAQELQADIHRSILRSLMTRGGIALGTVGVGAIWLGWLVAGRTLRPIQQITATARRVADHNLHERIALAGPRDELRELADTFDEMLDRLDRSFDGQRRFVANASHELRTPLAINRTLLEVAMGRPDSGAEIRQLGQTLLDVNARHERLMDGLLTLARSEGEVTDRQPVDLAAVSEHVIDLVRTEAIRTGVQVATALEPAPTTGDAILLERLALNLVQNAVRHNTDGGSVDVATRVTGPDVELVVTNTGPAVPAYEIPRLFEPFRRLGDRVGSARGSGLGLSIVASVALAHGGRVLAEPREGGGLVVRITLPAAGSSAGQGRGAGAQGQPRRQHAGHQREV